MGTQILKSLLTTDDFLQILTVSSTLSLLEGFVYLPHKGVEMERDELDHHRLKNAIYLVHRGHLHSLADTSK